MISANAEVICDGEGEYQQCQNVSDEDPLSCNVEENEIVAHTGADTVPMICDDQDILGARKTNKGIDDAKKEYTKQCKKKAKAYKKALLKQLFNKGKVGQWVQALFKKKKYKAGVQQENKKSPQNYKINMDDEFLSNKTPEEIEDHILTELEKASGLKDLKARALLAKEKPAFKLGYHESESVPLNVMVQTEKRDACHIEVGNLVDPKDAPLKTCEFCVEKNITGSFTNDCSYMVNKNLSENDAKKIVGARKTKDYCNHNMNGVENDLSEIENMSKQLCDIAKSGMKPEFKIETSRNLYQDKTVDLAKKRGEFIQKYIRKNLMDPAKCDLGEDAPDWLSDESEFNKAVSVTHPHYEGAAPGDYGPSPYATTPDDQAENIKNLETTLLKEKQDLQGKQVAAAQEKKNSEAIILTLRADIADLIKDYNLLSNTLKNIKKIDPSVLQMKTQLEDISHRVQDKQSRIDQIRQKISDSESQFAGYTNQLKVVDSKNAEKIKLLGEFYSEKNGSLTPARSTQEWDNLLFNSFKMVRISGKAVDESILPGVDPQYITPAVNIALNALVEVENFTCVVEPIETTKVTLGAVLKFPLKVAMIITAPAVAAVGAAGTIAISPLTTGLSFLCRGCEDQGNIPPVLEVGNYRRLSLSKTSRSDAWDATKGAFKAYTSWGGLLDVNKEKNNHVWSTQEVWEAEQERLAKKNKP